MKKLIMRTSISHGFQKTVSAVAVIVVVISMIPISTFAVTSQPDLIATKTNNVNGTAVVGGTFSWQIRIKNQGNATATFDNNKKILEDKMPDSGINAYGNLQTTNGGTTGTINCSLSGSLNKNLICKSSGTVTFPVDSFFDVFVDVSPNAAGSLVNPRSANDCKADKDNNVSESNENNNICANTVNVIANTGTIVIIKDAIPNDTQDFSYTTTGSGLSSFSLDDDSDNTLSNTKTFSNIAAGAKTVTEENNSDWKLTGIICSDPDNGTSVEVQNAKVNIDLDAGETVTCTYTNLKRARINITKETVGGFGTFHFTGLGGQDGFSLTTTDITRSISSFFDVFPELVGSTYNISEDRQAGWDQTNTTCADGVAVIPGGVANCTITNTKKGHIIIDKVTSPSQDPQSFSFTTTGSGYSNFDLSDTADPNDQDVVPGSYTVTESAVEGWRLNSLSCVDPTEDTQPNLENRQATIVVAPGETVRCTYTNQKRSRITVVKETTGGDGSFHFNGLGKDSGFTLDTSEGEDHRVSSFFDVFTEIDGSTYTITEDSKEGWRLDPAPEPNGRCVYGNESVGRPVTNGEVVNLDPGDEITCTFNNTKLGSITVQKFADPASGNFEFQLGGDSSDTAIVSVGSSHTFPNLAPGNYNVTEQNNNGYNVQSSCNSEFDTPGSITLSAGENLTCTFNNTAYGVITGKKFEDLNADGTDDSGTDPGLEEWTINLTKTADESGESLDVPVEFDPVPTDEDGNYSFSNLLPGTYKVCEELQEDWHESLPNADTARNANCGDNGYGYTVVLTAGGQIVNKNFGNYQDGVITGTKFEDLNGNGQWDKDEPTLTGWTIELRASGNTELLSSTTTGGGGSYTFSNLKPGNYTVKEVGQDGWVQKMPAGDSGYSFTITSGETEKGIDFGNFKKPTITIYKYNDLNGDGVIQKGEQTHEPTVENWPMALGRTLPQGEGQQQIPIEIVAMSLTGSDGAAHFVVDQPGDYKVFEAKQDGWVTTLPATVDSFFDITYRIDLPVATSHWNTNSFFDVFTELSGQEVTTDTNKHPLEFGNHRLVVISDEGSSNVSQASANILWSTDKPATSRVVYDTVSHPVLGSSVCPDPYTSFNCYGYVSTTPEFDNDPKVTSHSVTISGLISGTTYYFRTISKASPESVGGESSFGTSPTPSPTPTPQNNGGGGGGGGGISTDVLSGPPLNSSGGGGTVAGATTTATPSPAGGQTPTSSVGGSGAAPAVVVEGFSGSGQPSETLTPSSTETPEVGTPPELSPLAGTGGSEGNNLMAIIFDSNFWTSWWFWLLILIIILLIIYFLRNRGI